MKPIADKAEVSIDFPDKVYMGSFGRESGFEVRIEPDAMLLKLVRRGEHRRIVEFHLHYHLLADILRSRRLDAAELRPRWSQAVVQRFLFPTPGTVVSVHGAMEAAVGEGIALLEVRASPGAVVQPVTSHASRGGVVIAVADTREEAVVRAEAAAARVRIVTAPSATTTAYLLH